MNSRIFLSSIFAIAAFCIVAGAVKASPAVPAYDDGVLKGWNAKALPNDELSGRVVKASSGISEARPWPKWLYNEWREGPGEEPTRYAEILSENSVRFRVGNGAQSRLAITLRSGPDGSDAILTLSKGRFKCQRSYCQVLARFDNGAVLGYTGAVPASGNANVIFLNEHPAFVRNIRKARSLVIRAELEQEGTREFAFDTVGLRWP